MVYEFYAGCTLYDLYAADPVLTVIYGQPAYLHISQQQTALEEMIYLCVFPVEGGVVVVY